MMVKRDSKRPVQLNDGWVLGLDAQQLFSPLTCEVRRRVPCAQHGRGRILCSTA